MRAPILSVVVPAFDARSTIGRAVASALANTAELEVLVVEDGSADPVTPSDLPAGPVRIINLERNGGTARARNEGVKNARGRWIAFLDADDTYEPGRLDAALAFLDGSPSLDGLATDALLVSPDGSSELSAPRPNAEGLMHLRTGCIFAAHVLSRDIIERVGSFDPRWPRLEDVDYFLRLIGGGARIGYLPRPAYVYNLNPEGKTQDGNWIAGWHELRDICLTNAIRSGVPMRYRGVLLGRALKLQGRVAGYRLSGGRWGTV